VAAIRAHFLRRGIAVLAPSRRTGRDGLLVSGHACRDEQRQMIDLAEPRFFVPIHGARHHLEAHAEIAREANVSGVVVLENGESARVAGGRIERAEPFVSGRIFTWSGKAIADSVLGERRGLAQDGVAHVTVDLDEQGQLRDVHFASRGVIAEYMQSRAYDRAREQVMTAWHAVPEPRTPSALSEAVRLAARRALAEASGRKPMTIVSLRGPSRHVE
jgi:ribonuclease J